MSARPYLSLALLAYNEIASIEDVTRLASESLRSLGRDYELLLVDDGSSDGTRECIRQLAADTPHCRALYHPRNLGIAAGIRTCYFGSRGEWAGWLPADLQADPREIPRLVSLLEDCDVLVTFRDPARRAESRLRRAVSSIDRLAVRGLFGIALRDLHWVRFFRRSLLDRMRLVSRSPSVDVEMVLLAHQLGARIEQAPFDDRRRQHGEGRGASFANLLGAVRELLALRLRGVEPIGPGEVCTQPASEAWDEC